MSDIDKLRRDVDNIEENVITDKIDYYTQMGNPTTKNHEAFALYGDGDGWVLDDDGDRIYKQSSDDRESLRVLFNRYPELEFKEIIGVRFRFKLKNCSLTGVGLGDGTVMDYVHEEDSTEVISSASYVPLSEEEYESGLHSVPLIRTVNDVVLVGYDSYNWGFDNDEIKELLYDGYPVLEIIVEPDYTFAEVEVSNLTMEVYFESSMSKEINVIENRLEEINLPEMVLKQSDKSYLYFRAKELLSSSTLTAIRDYVNRDYGSTVFDGIDYVPKSTTLDGVEYVFSNDTLYVDDEYPVVYVAVRTKFNDSFGRYRDFNIESTLGVGGSDTVEYRYAFRTQNNATVDVDPTSIDGSTIPTGWSETMESVNATNRWCFRTTATKTNGKWSNWSSPILVGYYAKDGVDGKDGKDGAKGEKGEKGDKGDKGDDGTSGEDGLSTITLYRKANSLPDTPPLTGTIEVTYSDSHVDTITWSITQGIDEIDNIKRQLINEHSQYTNINDVNNIFGAYSEWQDTYDVLGDKRYVYMTKLVLNKDNVGSWSTPTIVAEIKNDSEDSSDMYSAADDSMVYTGKNGFKIYLYRYGSLVYYDIPSFTYTVKNYVTEMSDTLKESDFEGFGISSFGSCSNLQNISNVSTGAMIRITDNKFHLRVNTDAYNTSSNSKKVNFASHGVYQIKGTVDPDLCVEKDTETSKRLGLLKYFCFTAVFDGTDEGRAGKKLYFKVDFKSGSKRYYLTIIRQDIAKTFVDDNGEEFTTHYYARVAIRLYEGSFTFGVGFLGDKTYKEVHASRNVTVYKSDLVIEQRIVPEGVRYDFMVDDETATIPNITTVICTDSFMNNQISILTGGYGENYILTECTYDSTIYFPTTNTLSFSKDGGIIVKGSTTNKGSTVTMDCTPISNFVKSITFKKMKADNTVESSTTGTIQTYELASNLSLTGYKTDDIKVKR